MDAAAIKAIVDAIEQDLVARPTPSVQTALATVRQELPADAGGPVVGTWAALSDEKRKELERRLTALREQLRCVNAGPLMSDQCAPTRWIVALIVYALVGLGGLFALAACRWNVATEGPGIQAERQARLEHATALAKSLMERTDAEQKTVDEAKVVDAESEKKRTTGTEGNATTTTAGAASPEDGLTKPKTEAEKKPVAADALAKATERYNVALAREQAAWQAVAKARADVGPSPGNVLVTVSLLGALGGFLHLVSSLVMFIGNRQFLRSWIAYYVLAPFQGAGLAPIMYLLIAGTVLGLPSQNGGQPQNQNLLGIYAFSALTGLFAKQALEKMKDVFSTVFTKVKAQDAMAETAKQ